MNKIKRIKMVKAMEFITRQLNNEDIFSSWLLCGVADEYIPYAQLEVQPDDENLLDVYYEVDNAFADLMHLFLKLMSKAYKDKSGLCCDGVVSAEERY